MVCFVNNNVVVIIETKVTKGINIIVQRGNRHKQITHTIFGVTVTHNSPKLASPSTLRKVRNDCFNISSR